MSEELEKKPELQISQSIDSFSLKIIQDKSELIPSNSSQLKIIQNLVEEIKKNGHKYSLISCLFLQFYKANRDTLTKKELYDLLEEEIRQNKNRIISSHTDRCCMIDLKNYRRKAKDILKKKKWFSKRLNDKGEVEYKMNSKIVGPILPRILSQLKSIEKNKDDFMDITFDNSESEKKNDMQIIKIKEDDEDGEYDMKYSTPSFGFQSENIPEEEKKLEIKIEKHVPQEGGVNESEKKEIQQIEINLQKNENEEKEENTIPQDINENKENKETSNIYTNKKLIGKKRLSRGKSVQDKHRESKSKKMMFYVEKKNINANPPITTDKSNLENNQNIENQNPILNNVNKNINITIYKEELNEKDKLQNKLDTILNKGETLLNLINSKKLENEGTQKIKSLEDIIELKQKEIELAKINLEKIISYNQKLKSYNKEEVEENIKKIKDNHKEYKNKLEILKLFGKILKKSDIDEDTKSLMINYKTIYSKSQALLNKILLGLSKLIKEYMNIEEFIKILSRDDFNNKNKSEYLLNSEDMDKSIENLRNLFKNELNDVLNGLNLPLDDNNVLPMTNSETNLNSSQNNNNINLNSENQHFEDNNDMNNIENNIIEMKSL